MNRNFLLYLLGTGAVSFILLVAIGGAWINFTVDNTCFTAKERYELDDCVTALVNQLGDTEQSYADRNNAIWALGQLGDNRALPSLQQHYTGNIPEHEPWNQTLSQYELSKAIHLLEGGFNLSVVFRGLTLSQF